MSYDAEIAKKPLTGGEYDIIILQEREQRHIIGEGDFEGYHIMPNDEYCELRIQVEALKLLLDKKGIASQSDIEACITYLKTQPEIMMMYETITTAERKINEYKANPQQHLRDLLNAKINGNIY